MKQNGMEEGASSMFTCKRPGFEDTYLFFFKALDRFTSDPRSAGGRRARLAPLTCWSQCSCCWPPSSSPCRYHLHPGCDPLMNTRKCLDACLPIAVRFYSDMCSCAMPFLLTLIRQTPWCSSFSPAIWKSATAARRVWKACSPVIPFQQRPWMNSLGKPSPRRQTECWSGR